MKSTDIKVRTALYAHEPNRYTHGMPVVVLDRRMWEYRKPRQGRPGRLAPAPGERPGKIEAGWGGFEVGKVGLPVIVLNGKGTDDPQALLALELPVLEYTEESMQELRKALPEGFDLQIVLPVKIVNEWAAYSDLAAAEKAQQEAESEERRRRAARFGELRERLAGLGVECGRDGTRNVATDERAAVKVEDLLRLLDMIPKEGA